MSAEAALFSRSFPVGSYTVTLTIPKPTKGEPVAMACSWEPALPSRLSRAEWQQYVTGRTAALAELAGHLGRSIAVIDV